MAQAATAVLVDDVDPVAALTVADSALRVAADRSIGVDELILERGEQVRQSAASAP